eukprot:818437-Alexandrium_andersonii.AAC.1
MAVVRRLPRPSPRVGWIPLRFQMEEAVATSLAEDPAAGGETEAREAAATSGTQVKAKPAAAAGSGAGSGKAPPPQPP